jgi:hypothetical protein
MNETVNFGNCSFVLLGFPDLQVRLTVMKLPVSDKRNIVKQSDIYMKLYQLKNKTDIIHKKRLHICSLSQ